jgi:hypothetical protein
MRLRAAVLAALRSAGSLSHVGHAVPFHARGGPAKRRLSLHVARVHPRVRGAAGSAL